MTVARRFFTTRPKVVEYMTLTLSHPAFGEKRYVRNEFFPVTLGGKTYEPASMAIRETVLDDRSSVSYEVQLGRVGSQAKQLAKLVDAYPLGWVVGIDAKVEYYLSDDTSTPYRPSVTLSVGNFVIDGDSVAITLDTGNPRASQVARVYNGIDFPGTKAKV